MQLTSPIVHSSARIVTRTISVLALLLASGTRVEAAGPRPEPWGSAADTLSVTLTAPAGGTVKEGATAYFEVRVAGNTGSDTVTVTYTVSGTATAGDDYTALPGEVTLRGGEANALIALAAVEDTISDSGETVTLTLSGATGTAPVVVDTTPATVTIQDARSRQGENQRPRADAGSNQTVDERTLVNLDGSASEDPDDDPLNYLWTKTSGPDVSLVGANTAFASFTAPEVTSTTTMRFQLRVGDGRSFSYASTTVTVNHVNRAPQTKGSVSNVVTNRDSTGTVDMSSYFTELDNDDLTYTAESDDEGVVTVSVSGSEVTYKGKALGSATVTVTAADPEDAEAEQSFKVTVENLPPEADAGSNQAVDERTTATLDGSGSSDPDGDNLTYAWELREGPTVTLSDAEAVSPTFTTPEVTADTALTFRLTVSDGSLSDTDEVTVTVRHVNRAPTANAGSDQTVDERTTVTLNGSGSDPDGDALSYSWKQTAGPTATLSSTTVASPTFTGPEVTADTDLTFELTVSDGSLSDTDEVTVTVRHVNRAPTADAGNNQTVNERTTATLNGSGSDPDGDNLTYKWTQRSGPTVTLSSTTVASPTFTAPEVTSNTALTFRLTVSDGSLSDTDDVRVTVRHVNRAPTADAGNNQTVNERTTVRLSGSGSDPDGDNLNYSWTQTAGPTATLSSTTVASPTFTAPEVTTSSALTFRLTVSDGSLSATDDVTVTVRHINRAPTAAAGNNQTVNERTTVTLGGSGSDPDGDNLSYRWTQRTGPTVTLSSTTVASPTFTAPEVTTSTALTFRLTVSDGALSATDDVTVTVRQVNRAPTAAAGSDQTVDERTTVTLNGSGSDPDGDTLNYSWTQTAGPMVTLSSSTAAAPTFAAPEVTVNTTLTFRLTVSDGSLSATDDVTVTVRHVNRKPTAAAGSDQMVDEGTTVTLDGSGSSDPDGDSVSYSWEQTAGPTVTLSSTTAASPTFTAPDVTTNTTLTFRLTASDGSLSATDDVTVTVRHVNRAPTAAAGSDQTVDERTTVTLSGSGDDPDEDGLSYSWEQTAGPTATLSSATVAAPTFTAPEVTEETTLKFRLNRERWLAERDGRRDGDGAACEPCADGERRGRPDRGRADDGDAERFGQRPGRRQPELHLEAVGGPDGDAEHHHCGIADVHGSGGDGQHGPGIRADGERRLAERCRHRDGDGGDGEPRARVRSGRGNADGGGELGGGHCGRCSGNGHRSGQQRPDIQPRGG